MRVENAPLVFSSRHLPGSFNGATRTCAWKLGPGTRDEDISLASMEPRARARGNGQARDKFGSRWFGFNGATRTCAWKPYQLAIDHILSWTLQWSHAHVRVETSVTRQMLRQTSVASMEPRARARGNRDSGDEVLAIVPASMEPRERARGNRDSGDEVLAIVPASMEPRERARGNHLNKTAVQSH